MNLICIPNICTKIFVIIYIFTNKKVLNKQEGYYAIYNYVDEELPYYYNYPYSMSTRNTRGMRYDLRGDVPLTYYDTGPWLQSPRIF